jgi:hypothetical protein
MSHVHAEICGICIKAKFSTNGIIRRYPGVSEVSLSHTVNSSILKPFYHRRKKAAGWNAQRRPAARSMSSKTWLPSRYIPYFILVSSLKRSSPLAETPSMLLLQERHLLPVARMLAVHEPHHRPAHVPYRHRSEELHLPCVL